MDFLEALAALAQQHPSTYLRLEVEYVADVPIWEAAVILTLGDEDGDSPILAAGNGDTAKDALVDLLTALRRNPVR